MNNNNILFRLWRDPLWRSIFFQVLLIVTVIATGAWIINNTLTNLEHRGISTGFGFLSESAGFGIIQSLVAYDESHTFGRTFVVGLVNTLLVSFLGVILATIIGFMVGIARLSANWLLAKLASVYIEVFRNIPLLLQIFFWYFAVLGVLPHPRQSLSIGDSVFLSVRGIYMPEPMIEHEGTVLLSILAGIVCAAVVSYFNKKRRLETGQGLPFSKVISLLVLLGLPAIVIQLTGATLSWDMPVLQGFNFKGGLVIIPELAALLFALAIYTAAFIAEVVRAGIESVSKGQKEAAAALGLRPGRVLRLVVIPQAMRVIIPPLTNQYLNLIKNSSLATAIGYPDLVNVFAGTTLNQTGQAVEVIAMTMAVYLLISLTVSVLMNAYNRYTALVER
ncbi:MAG: amino acid ABC transporter permease [Endozoicomonas sp.]